MNSARVRSLLVLLAPKTKANYVKNANHAKGVKYLNYAQYVKDAKYAKDTKPILRPSQYFHSLLVLAPKTKASYANEAKYAKDVKYLNYAQYVKDAKYAKYMKDAKDTKPMLRPSQYVHSLLVLAPKTKANHVKDANHAKDVKYLNYPQYVKDVKYLNYPQYVKDVKYAKYTKDAKDTKPILRPSQYFHSLLVLAPKTKTNYANDATYANDGKYTNYAKYTNYVKYAKDTKPILRQSQPFYSLPVLAPKTKANHANDAKYAKDIKYVKYTNDAKPILRQYLGSKVSEFATKNAQTYNDDTCYDQGCRRACTSKFDKDYGFCGDIDWCICYD